MLNDTFTETAQRNVSTYVNRVGTDRRFVQHSLFKLFDVGMLLYDNKNTFIKCFVLLTMQQTYLTILIG